MSDTKHTPGSWERGHQSREIFGGSRHIASVHTAFGVWEANDGQREPDCRVAGPAGGV